AIADTGVGIAAEDISRIFDPFWSRRADSLRGTGLGLSICRAIVKHAGGRIEVESELGKGTTFTIILPDADQRSEAS
ncbi:MAG TPA: ATP-binding protein, partial [Hyphomicrobiales bacterium]|nr:ATP-binding protein [Hyphomicrobiales bacterium]